MLALSVVFLAFFHQATAAELSAVPPMPTLVQTSASSDCSKIKSDLSVFKENYLANAKIISDYTLVMAKLTGEWHAALSPLENTTVTLPVGTFTALDESATNVEAAVQDFYAYVDHVDVDIATFTENIESCKLSKSDYEKWTLAFQAFTEKSSEGLGVSVEYISSLATQFRDWQGKWTPYEAQSVFVASGEFDVVLEANEGLLESADLIESNAQLAIDELSRISLEELAHGRSSNDGTLQLYRR